jgi:hypothetical protein
MGLKDLACVGVRNCGAISEKTIGKWIFDKNK